MPGRSEFEFQFGQSQPGGPPRQDPGEPFRILIIADFSGRSFAAGAGTASPLAERTPRSVSIDKIDDVMSRFSPRVRLPGEETGSEIDVDLTRRDDFHPDRLLERSDLFGKLQQLREQIENPATFAAAAEELRRLGLASASDEEEPSPPSTPEDDREDDTSTLERLLGKTSSESQSPTGGISQLLANIVGPDIAPQASPHQDTYIRGLEEVLAARMRAVLHHPAFHRLESTWMGVDWLLRRVDTNGDLQIHLLDATKQELLEDVARAGTDLESSSLYRVLVERGVRTTGGKPWSLVLGDYFFGPDAEDMKLLAVLGAALREAGGSFLGGAAPSLLGCRSLAESPDPRDWQEHDPETTARWRELRTSVFASSIGLALPRFLLRAPYGARSDPIEGFPFEEIVDPADHERFLWGNSILACALAMATEFLDSSWGVSTGAPLDVADLPMHLYTEDGESKMKPGAEVVLTERAMTTILAAGIIPLLSHANQNAARIARLQSIADPPAALAGSWS